jgi:hypothetical protein
LEGQGQTKMRVVPLMMILHVGFIMILVKQISVMLFPVHIKHKYDARAR